MGIFACFFVKNLSYIIQLHLLFNLITLVDVCYLVPGVIQMYISFVGYSNSNYVDCFDIMFDWKFFLFRLISP